LDVVELKAPSKALLEVLVDSREFNVARQVVEEIRRMGVSVRVEYLDVGDYVVSSDVAVERKTVSDFVSTLTKRNLFEQLSRLRDSYSKPILVLEGDLSSIPLLSSINMNAVLGALATVARMGVSVVPTPSPSGTGRLIALLARQERRPQQGEGKRRVKAVRRSGLSDEQLFFMCGLPMIGRERAEAILRVYRTPLEALKRVDGWPKRVDGIGEVIVKRVKEVLETPFKV